MLNLKKKIWQDIGVSRLYCHSESLVAFLKAGIFINWFTGTNIKKDYAPNKKEKRQTKECRWARKSWMITYNGYYYYCDICNHHHSRKHRKLCSDVYWVGWHNFIWWSERPTCFFMTLNIKSDLNTEEKIQWYYLYELDLLKKHSGFWPEESSAFWYIFPSLLHPIPETA